MSVSLLLFRHAWQKICMIDSTVHNYAAFIIQQVLSFIYEYIYLIIIRNTIPLSPYINNYL
jgi:hypothetical protein